MLRRLAHVVLAHLAGSRPHLLKRNIRSKSWNGGSKVFVEGVAMLLVNTTVLVAMAFVESGLIHNVCRFGR